MARLRSSPRLAARHTGDLYGKGYQYDYPEAIQPIVLGPFKRLWPLGARDVPSDSLQSLRNGTLVDGAIYPLWSLTQTTVASRTIVGAFSTYNVNKFYRTVFYIDGTAANELKVEVFDGTNTSTVATGLTPGTSIRITAAAWQQYVYFGYDGATTLHRIDVVAATPTYGAVTGSPANVEFLFTNNNNMCAIYKSGNAYLVEWSVDSDPTDWAGSGSGQATIPGELGRPQGVGQFHQDVIIVCMSGATQMSATGSASPSFRFVTLDTISGCPWTNCVVSTGSALYYFTAHRRLFAFDGQEREVGIGEKTFENIPTLYHSARLASIVVSDTTASETLFLSTQSQEWSSDYNKGWHWIADSPDDTELGKLMCYFNDSSDTSVDVYSFDLDPASYDSPVITTGRYYMGREVWVDVVEIIRTKEGAPNPPALKFRRQLQNGTMQDVEYSPSTQAGVNEGGTTIRYHISGPAMSFGLTFSEDVSGSLAGPFLVDSMDANGNVPVDPNNPSTGYRGGTLDANDNMPVGSSETQYYATGLDANGNMTLQLAADIWAKNVGFDRVIIYGKEMHRGSSTVI